MNTALPRRTRSWSRTVLGGSRTSVQETEADEAYMAPYATSLELDLARLHAAYAGALGAYTTRHLPLDGLTASEIMQDLLSWQALADITDLLTLLLPQPLTMTLATALLEAGGETIDSFSARKTRTYPLICLPYPARRTRYLMDLLAEGIGAHRAYVIEHALPVPGYMAHYARDRIIVQRHQAVADIYAYAYQRLAGVLLAHRYTERMEMERAAYTANMPPPGHLLLVRCLTLGREHPTFGDASAACRMVMHRTETTALLGANWPVWVKEFERMRMLVRLADQFTTATTRAKTGGHDD